MELPTPALLKSASLLRNNALDSGIHHRNVAGKSTKTRYRISRSALEGLVRWRHTEGRGNLLHLGLQGGIERIKSYLELLHSGSQVVSSFTHTYSFPRNNKAKLP